MGLPRSVNIKLRANGLDHETFGSNETGSDSFETNPPLIIHDRNTISFIPFIMKWGGECRVEITFNIEVLGDDTSVKLFGEALFFEGTSVNTEELNGRIRFDETIGSTSGQSDFVIRKRVDNQSEGKDYADFSFEVRNTGVAPP